MFKGRRLLSKVNTKKVDKEEQSLVQLAKTSVARNLSMRVAQLNQKNLKGHQDNIIANDIRTQLLARRKGKDLDVDEIDEDELTSLLRRPNSSKTKTGKVSGFAGFAKIAKLDREADGVDDDDIYYDEDKPLEKESKVEIYSEEEVDFLDELMSINDNDEGDET